MKSALHNFNPYNFADIWVNDWNNGPKLKNILKHYREDIVLISPHAKKITGSPIINGKCELKLYWTSAVQQIKTMQFELINAFWDSDKRTLIILYMANIDNSLQQCTDMLWLDYSEKIYRSAVLYGASINNSFIDISDKINTK